MAVRYEVVTSARTGKERVHAYTSEDALGPGDILRLQGRDRLVVSVEEGEPPRAIAKPARYRLRLHHPDGREELGAFRRYRPDGPRLGHAFTTIEDGGWVSWEVVDEALAFDEEGEPFLDLVAERDYSELEELPNHELEHALARREAEVPDAALETIARAQTAGLAVELVALDPGEEPDWEAARSYVDALILDEIEDDLIELCGVDPDRDPRDGWLRQVKERLQSDLTNLRADIEGDHEEIEEWEFQDGRIFASVGSIDDESNPDSGHGWMARLVDVSALTAAGFARVRKADL
jgi:hypothetical protein